MRKLALVFMLMLGVSTSSCSWFGSNVKPVVEDGFDCVKEAAAAASKDIDVITAIADVTKVVLDAVKDPSSLATLLEGLVVKYGPGIVACTVNAIEQQHTPPPAPAGQKAEPPDDVAKLAASVMQQHKWKIVPHKK